MDNKTKHTPGPWELEFADDVRKGYVGISRVRSAGEPYCSLLAEVVWCMNRETHSPENEANAHLIAAAPYLLKALQKICSEARNLGEAHIIAIAAINKAIKENND